VPNPANSENRSRHIAPRLASKVKRVYNGGALPPHIKHALQMIAYARGESLSWVMEQTFYSHFNLRPPKLIGERGPDLDIAAPTTVKIKYPRSA